MTLPPHLRALLLLKKDGVDFLMVGAMALNSFAPEISATYSTADCDILLRPTLANFRRALRALSRAGYSLSAGGEPLVRSNALVFKHLLDRRAAVRAEKKGGLPLDLLVEAKGFTFAQWWRRRTHFKAGRSLIPCASLDQILESKRQTGRAKDKALLSLYAAAVRPFRVRGSPARP